MSSKQDDQGKLIMYQMLQAQFEELKKQAMLVENRMLDLETTLHALDEMKKFKKDNQTLVPLGSGCYSHSRMHGEEILLDIGAGVMVSRNLPSVEDFLEKRKKEIENAGKNITLQSEEIVKNLNELTPEVQKIIMDAQQKKG
jgi:prefoldin alpha subunit